MKNQHSVGKFFKRFAVLALSAGSLIFSTEALSKPECNALHDAANEAGSDYVLMANLCPSCYALLEEKFQKYVETNAAWKACEET